GDPDDGVGVGGARGLPGRALLQGGAQAADERPAPIPAAHRAGHRKLAVDDVYDAAEMGLLAVDLDQALIEQLAEHRAVVVAIFGTVTVLVTFDDPVAANRI